MPTRPHFSPGGPGERRPWYRTPEALLFFGLLILYGILINNHDLETFNLQQMGVEAIVERGHFYVDGSSTPQLQPGGDVFEHDGHLYAAKQPGQFMAGAVVYAILHRLGISYSKNFLLTAAWVTFLTASLVTAAAALVVFRLARRWNGQPGSLSWPLFAALSFGLASSAVPYAGVAHHDALASGYLLAAFSLTCRLSDRPRSRHAALPAMLAGALLGLTLTTSMLPFFMVLAVVLYFVWLRQWQCFPYFVAGGAIGISPLLAYNAISFGHPFLLANVAGEFSDTFFAFDWHNLVSKLGYYGVRVSQYIPIVWVGLVGLALLPPRLRREQVALCALLVALGGYVFNIETIGGCQYGPRYLLPALPYAALGIIGFSHLSRRAARRVAATLGGAAFAFSAAVNLIGGAYGAMYCDLRRYAFAHYVAAVQHDVFRVFPLALWLVIPLGLWIVQVVAAWEDGRRSHGQGGDSGAAG